MDIVENRNSDFAEKHNFDIMSDGNKKGALIKTA